MSSFYDEQHKKQNLTDDRLQYLTENVHSNPRGDREFLNFGAPKNVTEI